MNVRYMRLGPHFGATGTIITTTDWEAVITLDGTDRHVWATPYLELA